LYKHTAKAYKLDDDSDSAFILTLNVFTPTTLKVRAVQAKVDNDALTRAIETVKGIVRLSGRL
jgi:hypothetical protein